MDIYELVLENLLQLPVAALWPGMPEILTRLAAQKDRHWRVALIACQAVKGTPEQAVSVIAAIACLHSSILLVDDLLDVDPRGLYHQLGAPATANLALALQALGLETLALSELPPPSKLKAMQHFNRAALTIAAGQECDTRNPENEAAYWQVVDLKSAPFFGTAMYLGALAGSASPEQADAFLEFGSIYGELIQIHDDLNDALAVPANPDWALGRTSLPILFAHQVDHTQRQRFQELRLALREKADSTCLGEGQGSLIESGAISYGVYELIRRHRLAHDQLKMMAACDRLGLELLLEDVIAPVRNLLTTIGLPFESLFSELDVIPAG